MERLALYLRLSLEDEGEKDESNSISNQRKLIYEYIHHDSELSGYEAVEFSDDGFSGTNMNRPGMQKLLKEPSFYRVDLPDCLQSLAHTSPKLRARRSRPT